ncbi:uncharacterized oxidoreductase YtbE-like isoform X2 [Liolophura sinensis]
MAAVTVATSLDSRVTLNSGFEMPLFGLGVYKAASGDNGEAEKAVIHALQYGYRLIDTAEFYSNEADVGRGVKKAGLKREDVFVVSKIWDANGYDYCRKLFNEAFKKMDIGYIDLYLIHSPMGSDNCGTYRAMLDLQKQGLIRSCGVSNYGIQHLEGLKTAGLPTPSVNQIELHPWQHKSEVVKYCRENGIAVMGYSPLAKGQRFSEPILTKLSERYGKTAAQVMIRWSVQKGYITIPKSAKPARIVENAQVFDWSISDADMAVLDKLPQKSCTWDPTTSPWRG